MISNYRFRNAGVLVVLQVYEPDSWASASNNYSKWRDAKTEDLLDVASLIRGNRQIDVAKILGGVDEPS